MKRDFLPINPSPISPDEALSLGGDILAFIGDGVQTLYARKKAVILHGGKTGYLHLKVADEVSAHAQAQAIKTILDGLSDFELSIYKRSRNTTKSRKAKNAGVVEYNIATGFEGLIGFLYLTNNHERLNDLLSKAYLGEKC